MTDVAFIYSEDRCVMLTTIDGHTVLTTFPSLAKAEATLDGTRFFRLSRDTLANIASIGTVSKHFNGRLKVELRASGSNRTENVSASRREAFLAWLGAGR